jgi:membrane-associated phospholipid phosphatase
MYSKKEKIERRSWFLLVIGYFAAGYLAVNWISQFRSHYIDVSLPWDYKIPFIPVFIFGYTLVYLSVVLLYFTMKDMQDFRRAIVAFLLVTTVHYIFFLLLPVKLDFRADLSRLSGFSIEATKLYYFIDKPYNCFPSLHVAYSTLAIMCSWKNHHIMRIVFLLMAVIVAISVVFVKQHYILDVVTGAVSGILLYLLAAATEKYWTPLFKN